MERNYKLQNSAAWQKMRMILVAALTFVLAALLLTGCGSMAPVGIVDPTKIMSESPQIKQFQDQLTNKGKELTETLDKDKDNITPEEFQKRQEAAYSEFMKTKQDMEKQVESMIKENIEKVAAEKKLGAVLYKGSVAQGGIDITDDVLKKMQ